MSAAMAAKFMIRHSDLHISKMTPEDRQRLVKARPELVRSLDVETVLPLLTRPEMFTKQDVDKIMSDPRRRERVVLFLTMLKSKSPQTFHAFCDILESRFPHLFLLLSEWDQDDGDMFGGGLASEARLDDEWATLHRCREYLISQIDGGKVASILREKDVLTVDQENQIIRDKDLQRRTETFLDILEMKPPEAFHTFLEVIGDLYPHVYLALTSNGRDDDW